jgi:hypothetical protein
VHATALDLSTAGTAQQHCVSGVRCAVCLNAFRFTLILQGRVLQLTCGVGAKRPSKVAVPWIIIPLLQFRQSTELLLQREKLFRWVHSGLEHLQATFCRTLSMTATNPGSLSRNKHTSQQPETQHLHTFLLVCHSHNDQHQHQTRTSTLHRPQPQCPAATTPPHTTCGNSYALHNAALHNKPGHLCPCPTMGQKAHGHASTTHTAML